MTRTASPTSPPRSLAGWQAKSLHTVTCPSGQRVRIRILGLGTILQHGDLPEDLIDIALIELSSEGGAAAAIAKDIVDDEISEAQKERALKRLGEFGSLMRHLAITAIEEIEVAPDEWEPIRLTMDDIDSLPEDDLAMVAEIVQRLRGVDAKGVTIGVEPLNRWEVFHEVHGLSFEDCDGCQTFIQRLSSSDVGEV